MNAAQIKRLYNTTGGTFFDRSHTRRLKAKIDAVATDTQQKEVYYFIESVLRSHGEHVRIYKVYVLHRTPLSNRWTIDQIHKAPRLENVQQARAYIRQLAKGTQE